VEDDAISIPSTPLSTSLIISSSSSCVGSHLSCEQKSSLLTGQSNGSCNHFITRTFGLSIDRDHWRSWGQPDSKRGGLHGGRRCRAFVGMHHLIHLSAWRSLRLGLGTNFDTMQVRSTYAIILSLSTRPLRRVSTRLRRFLDQVHQSPTSANISTDLSSVSHALHHVKYIVACWVAHEAT
jgi:hypothetical protein